jgi:RNA polymerase sigma-70 factor (ECF subfamily)
MTDFAAGSRHHATQSLSSSPSPQNTRALLPRSHLLEALYRDERAGVLAYLKRKIGHEHANDLAQEVFLRAAGSAQLHHLRNPGGFLHCIARNLAIDFARRRRCRIVTLPLTENVDGATLPCQEDRLHAAETKQLFEEALAELPAKTARVFAMSRFEKKSYREIHLELGVGVSTVEYHMTKALAHLRRELAARGA